MTVKPSLNCDAGSTHPTPLSSQLSQAANPGQGGGDSESEQLL